MGLVKYKEKIRKDYFSKRYIVVISFCSPLYIKDFMKFRMVNQKELFISFKGVLKMNRQ